MKTEPIIAIATASGRGAVGIVRLSADDLSQFIQTFFRQTLSARVATYLPFEDGQGQCIDKGLAIYFPAPHSYTGEDVLELQAHGGAVVLQLLVQRCLEVAKTCNLEALRLAQPGEFTQRAFLNGKIDLAQAEAVADLIDASTQAAARSAARSLAGEFSQKLQPLADELLNLRMLVEATLDFPEEEIDFLQKARAHERLHSLQNQLKMLQAQAHVGALLNEGLKVVIAGQPNAGKSSLLNALAGAELAIVTPVAGTTRDKVAQTIQIQGVPLHIIDTAGLRQSADMVEQIGVQRAWQEIENADIVLFLHDLPRYQLQSDYVQQDTHIAHAFLQRLGRSTRVVHVWNKVDEVKNDKHASNLSYLLPNIEIIEPICDKESHLVISVKTLIGLENLRLKLLSLAGHNGSIEGTFIARERHLQALAKTAHHLEVAQAQLFNAAHALDLMAEDLRLAHDALGAITGRVSADDLLGVIFSKFCIGK